MHWLFFWKTTVTIERKLEVFQNKCLRRILKSFWPNTIPNEDETGMSNITETIQLRRRRWLGHVCRMPPNSLLNRLSVDTTGEEKLWQPRETWHKTVERELKNSGLSFETVPREAADSAW
jgi:hypothetical protein